MSSCSSIEHAIMARYVICCLLVFAAVGRADDPSPFEPTKNYEVRKSEGWTVMVHPALAKEQPALLERTMLLLGNQLYQIERMVPRDAVAKLRGVKVWIENFAKHHPCMCYHPAPGWLRG